MRRPRRSCSRTRRTTKSELEGALSGERVGGEPRKKEVATSVVDVAVTKLAELSARPVELEAALDKHRR